MVPSSRNRTPSSPGSDTTIDWATNRSRTSRTCSRATSPPAHTPSAASRSKPPVKTESRAQSSRSETEHSEWLQSITAFSVCCRCLAARFPPMRRANRPSKRSTSCSRDRVRSRVTASSIANGRPSSRAQSRTAAIRFDADSSKPGCSAAARSTRSWTASYPARVSAAESCHSSGTARGGTANRCSPSMPRFCLLVASTFSPCVRRSVSATNAAQLSTTCSQLSSTRSSSVSPTWSTSLSTGRRVDRSTTPSAFTTACGTCPASVRRPTNRVTGTGRSTTGRAVERGIQASTTTCTALPPGRHRPRGGQSVPSNRSALPEASGGITRLWSLPLAGTGPASRPRLPAHGRCLSPAVVRSGQSA